MMEANKHLLSIYIHEITKTNLMQFTIDFLDDLYIDVTDEDPQKDVKTLFSLWRYRTDTFHEVIIEDSIDKKAIKDLLNKIEELVN